MSPVYLNIYLDDLEREAERRKRESRYGQEEVVLVADNVSIQADTRIKLQEL